MNDDQIDEVWAMLDREKLAAIARSGPPPVFAAISGAHLYGFASPDSDVDLRGAFMLSARQLLGLHPPDETVSIADDSDIDLDWVAHDVRKFARLMTNHNGYVLEQLYSPLVVVTGPAHEALREVGRGCVTRPTARHYLGFANGRLKRLGEPDPTVKHMLYAYRVLLTGIHLMRSGEVESNVVTLNESFRIPEISALVERKRTGAEKMQLEPRDLDVNRPILARLVDELERARDASSLPEEPTTVAELDELVVRLRLESERQAP